MPLTPVELVRAHVRAHSLLALQDALSVPSWHTAALRAMDSRSVEMACLDPTFRAWAADTAEAKSMARSRRALELIESVTATVERVTILPVTDSLRRIMGAQYQNVIISDPARVSAAWATAELTLQQLELHQVISLVHTIDLLAGLQGPLGRWRIHSLPQFPGFAAVGVNNPALALAEQAVQVAVSTTFAAWMTLSSDCQTLADERVGVLSPLTNVVSTIQGVAREILTNAAIRQLWRALPSRATAQIWMEVSARRTAGKLLGQCLRTLDARLAVAMTSLCDAAGGEACAQVARLAAEWLGEEIEAPARSMRARRELPVAAGVPTSPALLSPIERAQVDAAVNGDKVSRVTICVADIPTTALPLVSQLAVVASSWIARAVPDPKLLGFSNLSDEPKPVLAAVPDSEVHLYLHRDGSLARAAALLDRQDLAGELLGIPRCCREWFSREWPAAREAGGDVFAVMLRYAARGGHVSVASECDASAMYRGGGLCWHFPCSPSCVDTVRISRARRERLAHRDPILLRELDEARRESISLLPDGSYRDGEATDEGAVLVRFR